MCVCVCVCVVCDDETPIFALCLFVAVPEQVPEVYLMVYKVYVCVCVCDMHDGETQISAPFLFVAMPEHAQGLIDRVQSICVGKRVRERERERERERGEKETNFVCFRRRAGKCMRSI